MTPLLTHWSYHNFVLSLHIISVGFNRLGNNETALQRRHNERDCVSNHRHLDHLLNRLFRRRSKTTSKLRATGLCEGNSPVTGALPVQRISNVEKKSFDDVIMASDAVRQCSGGRFRNTYELLNLRALKFSHVNKIHICQCKGKISYPYIERYDFYTTLKL